MISGDVVKAMFFERGLHKDVDVVMCALRDPSDSAEVTSLLSALLEQRSYCGTTLPVMLAFAQRDMHPSRAIVPSKVHQMMFLRACVCFSAHFCGMRARE